ncbi:nitroreductase family deazaflavin-dependent oxidoreductase [Microbacterium sp. MC2]
MTQPSVPARIAAWALGNRRLMRLPIGLYRAGLGWVFGERLVMIEHLGRVSQEPRYVVVEVVERGRNTLRVVSGFGTRAQWYRNLRANGVAYLSTGRARRVPAHVRFLDDAEAEATLTRYGRRYPKAYRELTAALDLAAGGEAHIAMVEFTPPEPAAVPGLPAGPGDCP